MNFEIPSFKIGQLAGLIGAELHGDGEIELAGFNPSPEKAGPTELCFAFSPKYIKMLKDGELNAGAYIVPTEQELPEGINYLAVKRPKLVIKQLLDTFAPKRYSSDQGIHPSATVDPRAEIAEHVVIMAGAHIGANVKISTGSVIKQNVVIEDDTIIGENVIIHPNAIIGSDGFSFITQEESVLDLLSGSRKLELQELYDEEKHTNNPQLKVLSAGNVIIEDNVEIGAGTCIDRGTLGPTIIGAGTKIDNLVQIAHNCKIGKDCLIVAQAGLAGSVTLEDRVVIAGHSGCKDGITIGHDSILLAASHAHRDAPPLSLLGGDPAIPAKDYVEKEKQLRRAIRTALKDK